MQVDRPKKRAQDLGVRLGAAIRAARGAMRQEDLASKVKTDQPTISKWERGLLRPTLEELAAIEGATGRPPGWVLVTAGYVEGLNSVPQAIAGDPQLSQHQKDFLANAYQAALALSGTR